MPALIASSSTVGAPSGLQLGVIQAAFPSQHAAELIPTATQIGYAAGLFLLVPPGDMMDRRRLIIVNFGLLAVSLALAAMAPTAWALVGASLVLGMTATVAQQIIPFAASIAVALPRNHR